MAKETETRKKAVAELAQRGWITWYPSKVRFKQNDVFGIIDLLALKGRKLRHIQLTTPKNVARCRKKILDFFKKNKVKLPLEIWHWVKKEKRFKKERL
ncbi:MAG: hypothetical protein G01um101430_105 [Parcubacteria group bacterium Gr01-1014_30]|nr:MAG: hypothetical protein G01um101430_105 [Parcubacteria group bacterium Gr01-1014_30]